MPNPWEYGSDEEKQRFGGLTEDQYNELLAQLNAMGIDPATAWGNANAAPAQPPPAPSQNIDNVGAGFDPNAPSLSPDDLSQLIGRFDPTYGSQPPAPPLPPPVPDQPAAWLAPDAYPYLAASQPQRFPPPPSNGRYDSVGADLDSLGLGENRDAFGAMSPRPGPISFMPAPQSLLTGDKPAAGGRWKKPALPAVPPPAIGLWRSTAQTPLAGEGAEGVQPDRGSMPLSKPTGAWTPSPRKNTVLQSSRGGGLSFGDIVTAAGNLAGGAKDATGRVLNAPTDAADRAENIPYAGPLVRTGRTGLEMQYDLNPALWSANALNDVRTGNNPFAATVDRLLKPITASGAVIDTGREYGGTPLVAILTGQQGSDQVAYGYDIKTHELRTPRGDDIIDPGNPNQTISIPFRPDGFPAIVGRNMRGGFGPMFHGWHDIIRQYPWETYQKGRQAGDESNTSIGIEGMFGVNPKIGNTPIIATAIEQAENPFNFFTGGDSLAAGALDVGRNILGVSGGVVAGESARKAGVPDKYLPIVNLLGGFGAGHVGGKLFERRQPEAPAAVADPEGRPAPELRAPPDEINSSRPQPDTVVPAEPARATPEFGDEPSIPATAAVGDIAEGSPQSQPRGPEPESPGPNADSGNSETSAADQFTELPPGVITGADIQQHMDDVEATVRSAAAAKGFHKISARAMIDMFGGDLSNAEKMARVVALLSPAKGVLGQAVANLRAWAQHATGDPIAAHQDPMWNARLQRALRMDGPEWEQQVVDWLQGKNGEHGRKTMNFYLDFLDEIDPERAARLRKAAGAGVTVDRNIAKAVGYTDPTVTRGQYDFAEYLIREIARRLGWEPKEVGAALFAAQRGSDTNYSDSFERHVAPYHDPLGSTPEQLADRHRDLADAAKAEGVPFAQSFDADGNPTTSFYATPDWGNPNPTVDPRQAARIDSVVRKVAEKRGEAPGAWTRPFAKARQFLENATDINIGRRITADEHSQLQAGLGEDFVVFPTEQGAWAIRLPNARDIEARAPKSRAGDFADVKGANQSAHQQVMRAGNTLWGDSDVTPTFRRFAADGSHQRIQEVSKRNGQGQIAGLSPAGGPNVRQDPLSRPRPGETGGSPAGGERGVSYAGDDEDGTSGAGTDRLRDASGTGVSAEPNRAGDSGPGTTRGEPGHRRLTADLASVGKGLASGVGRDSLNLPPEIGLLASVLGGSAWQDDADRRQKAGGDSITGGPTQPSGAPARQGMAQVLAKQSAPSTYQGYTPAEARQIDALANRVLAATKSKLPDQLQQLQALRGLAPGADPRIVNGVRRKILGLLDGTDEAERVAPRYSQVGSFLDPANHGRPLTRQELARLVA